MSLVFDVTADQPSTTGHQAVQELAPEEIASLALSQRVELSQPNIDKNNISEEGD